MITEEELKKVEEHYKACKVRNGEFCDSCGELNNLLYCEKMSFEYDEWDGCYCVDCALKRLKSCVMCGRDTNFGICDVCEEFLKKKNDQKTNL